MRCTLCQRYAAVTFRYRDVTLCAHCNGWTWKIDIAEQLRRIEREAA